MMPMFATMRSFSSQADESALSLRERARAEGARVRVSGFDHTATLTGLFCLLLALTPSANAETVAKAGRFGGIYPVQDRSAQCLRSRSTVSGDPGVCRRPSES